MKKALLIILLLALTACTGPKRPLKAVDYEVRNLRQENQTLFFDLYLDRPDLELSQPRAVVEQSSLNESLQTSSISINSKSCTNSKVPAKCEIAVGEEDLNLEVKFVDSEILKTQIELSEIKEVDASLEITGPSEEDLEKNIVKFNAENAIRSIITLETCYLEGDCFFYEYVLEKSENTWLLSPSNPDQQFDANLIKSAGGFEIEFTFDPNLFDIVRYEIRSIVQENLEYRQCLLKNLELKNI